VVDVLATCLVVEALGMAVGLRKDPGVWRKIEGNGDRTPF